MLTKARKIGPLGVRPEVYKGIPTGRYILDIPGSLTNTGKRMRKFYPSLTQAQGIARELKREMELKRLGFVKASARRGLSFRDAATRWEESLELSVRVGELRRLTLRTYRTRLTALLAHFEEQSLNDIDPVSIKRYQAERIEAGRKPPTINGEMRVLRRLLGWCVDNDLLAALPKIPKLKEERRWLDIPSVADILKLIECMEPKARVAVWLMAETGLRPSEALNLPWAHVDARGCITIRAFRDWQPKNRSSERRVYPSDDLMRELLALPKTGDYVFPGRDPKKPIQSIRSPLATAVKRAKLNREGNLSVKLFRKAFATISAGMGRNQSVVSAMMGHAPGSKVTDQFYMFVGDQVKQQNRLHLLNMTEQGVA